MSNAPTDPAPPPILAVADVRKAFAGVVVLDGVRFDVRAGVVHTVMDENGAGKSTLMKILAGVHRPDAGDVLLDGVPVTIASPHAPMSRGIALIHQEPLSFPDLPGRGRDRGGRRGSRRAIQRRARRGLAGAGDHCNAGDADRVPRAGVHLLGWPPGREGQLANSARPRPPRDRGRGRRGARQPFPRRNPDTSRGATS